MDIYKKLQECTGFQWDEHNTEKNWDKHNVSPVESEEVFFNRPMVAQKDLKHSQQEKRYYVLGKTDENRTLFIVFTIRKTLIRVISSRDMNKKERKTYENYI